MTRRHILPLLGFGTALWAIGVHGAAASPDAAVAMPIQVSGASLAGETSLPLAPPDVPKISVAGAFQPAPMPDPDVDPPSGAGAHGPSLTPALFSHKEEFAGDGFSSASDADHGIDHRRAPAAGLNWSVPVK